MQYTCGGILIISFIQKILTMKTKLQLFILCMLIVFSVKQSNAQSTLIQFWDFNQVRPTSGGGGDSLGTTISYDSSSSHYGYDTLHSTWPLTADYSATGLTKGHIVYYRPQYHYSSFNHGLDSILDNGAGGSVIYDYSSSHYSYFNHSDSGFAEGNAYIRARNPSDSCELWLYMPTTGYKNIQLQFAFTSSSPKGARYNIFSYSTDGGTTWKLLTAAMDTFGNGGHFHPDTLELNSSEYTASAWVPQQINFTSDTSVNNKAGFILRFRLAGLTNPDGSTGDNSVGGSGNDRYDNFALWGTSVTAGIDELTASDAGYGIYPNPTHDVLNIISTYEGEKLMTIYNTLGQQLNNTQKVTGKQTSLKVSDLTTGVYFIRVNELETGSNYTLKFVKE